MRKLLLVVLIALPLPAHAWGRTGHEIVGYLAEQLLTPNARAGVRRLLHGRRLSDSAVANWADDLTQHLPESGRWHYVNIPPGVEYNADRDCPNGACVVVKIGEYWRKLTDRSRTDAERADALRFVVHLVADGQQPLHCVDAHDRGGNDVEVRAPGHDGPLNLHQVWDSALLDWDRGPRSVKLYEQTLARDLTPVFVRKLQQGTVVDWINQCHEDGELVLDGLKIRGGRERITLPAGYVKDEGPVMELDLERAAVRVATVINAALASEPISHRAPRRHHHHHHY